MKAGFSSNTQKTLAAAEATAQGALDIKSKVFLGNINVTLVDVERIVPDLNNPRDLKVTKEEILSGFNFNNPDYELLKSKITSQQKIIEIEQLERLAKSIKQNGLLNAIVVYKEDDHLYIITGERRYLSCLLLGYESIPTKILNKKPNTFQLRVIQWAENCDREDLTAWDRLENVRSIVESYINDNNTPLSSRKLADIINIGKSQAAKYLQLLKEPIDSTLISGIKENKISSLKIADFLLSIQEIDIKETLINLAINGMPLSELEKKLLALQENTLPQQANILVKLRFSAPKKITTASFIIKNLIENKCLSEHKNTFLNVNWDNPHEINRAWQKLIKIIEAQVTEEIN